MHANAKYYPGFGLSELDKYERVNQCAITVISMLNADGDFDVIRRTNIESENIIYLNLFIDHLSYVSNFDKAIQNYTCETCAKMFRDKYNLERHVRRDCKAGQRISYPRDDDCLFMKPDNLISRLVKQYQVNTIRGFEVCEGSRKLASLLTPDLYKYDYLIVFDFEALLDKFETDSSQLTQITYRHVPSCFSIASNVLDEKSLFVYDEDPRTLVRKLFKHFDKIARKAGKLMLTKMMPLFKMLKAVGLKESKTWKEVIDYCKQCPIIGFNNGKYDQNLLKEYGFVAEIVKRDPKPFIIKNGNQYKEIKTERFLFLDQMLYCAPGCDLKGYCAAFLGKNAVTKFYFPYEKFRTHKWLRKPVNTLTKEDFWSSLKNENMIGNDWDYFVAKCKEVGIWDGTRLDLLEYYNKMDVEPFLNACLKHKEVFYKMNIDMHKDGITLSGLAQKLLCKFGLESHISPEVQDDECRVNITTNSSINRRIKFYKLQDKDRGENLVH